MSLETNGVHSFNRGLDTFSDYERGGKKDDFLLKESIMFLHHGIELLMKQVLINMADESLIFSDISSETIKKIIKAKNEKISVFNLPKPPRTATYLEVIDRVRAFVDTPEVDESLKTRLEELNSLRNNLEHYGIEENKNTIESLILNLKNPLTNFFQKGGVNLGTVYDERWKEAEKALLLHALRLRMAGSIKRAEIDGNKAIIEYAENFEEYKHLQPQSTVTEELYKSYWKTGDAIIKALNDGGVRLLRKTDLLEEVNIVLPFEENIYEIKVHKKELEKFLGYTMEETRADWDNTFSDRYVYDEDGRKEFFNKFGTVTKIG